MNNEYWIFSYLLSSTKHQIKSKLIDFQCDYGKTIQIACLSWNNISINRLLGQYFFTVLVGRSYLAGNPFRTEIQNSLDFVFVNIFQTPFSVYLLEFGAIVSAVALWLSLCHPSTHQVPQNLHIHDIVVSFMKTFKLCRINFVTASIKHSFLSPERWIYPFVSIFPQSPVWNHPSTMTFWVATSLQKYPFMTVSHGHRFLPFAPWNIRFVFRGYSFWQPASGRPTESL